jgi:hypothetical protein
MEAAAKQFPGARTLKSRSMSVDHVPVDLLI